jgi:hypothetical protein
MLSSTNPNPNFIEKFYKNQATKLGVEDPSKTASNHQYHQYNHLEIENQDKEKHRGEK